MTAKIYGQPGKEVGDKITYKALKDGLPDGAIVYAQPDIIAGGEKRNPDYVIVYDQWGVVILEVKDWIHVKKADRKGALVKRRNGEDVWKTSPVRQAQTAAHLLQRCLEQDKRLLNYAGKLDFPYAFGGVLPFIDQKTINWLKDQWGDYILGREDIAVEHIAAKLSHIPRPFRRKMSREQVDVVRAIVDPNNASTNPHTGEFKGIYDPTQEQIYKEQLPAQVVSRVEPGTEQQSLFELPSEIAAEARTRHLESGLPEEVVRLRTDSHIRLVRGFAGTGKTDVLVLKARFLYKNYPDLRILVTTFNDSIYQQRLKPELEHIRDRVDVIKFDTLCADIYKKRHGSWQDPQDIRGLVAKMAKGIPEIEEYGIDFLADEFRWMKEIGRTNRGEYIEYARDGRGGAAGRKLGRMQKEHVFDLFEIYQRELDEMPGYDWVDLHDKALRYLTEDGIQLDNHYNVILIDEAQHFAPTWMLIIYQYLAPNGYVFLCDDPSQSVYRYFSWRQKYVDVIGRTQWLRIPYRNTRQIFEAAYSLIESDEAAQTLLSETDGVSAPDLDSVALRQGAKPKVIHCQKWRDEQHLICTEIEKLLGQGILHSEIAILHTRQHVIDKYNSLLKGKISVLKAREQTGMEYKVVFIPAVQELSEQAQGSSWQDSQSRLRFQFYVMMTRARNDLYMLYEQHWPKELEPIIQYAEQIDYVAS